MFFRRTRHTAIACTIRLIVSSVLSEEVVSSQYKPTGPEQDDVHLLYPQSTLYIRQFLFIHFQNLFTNIVSLDGIRFLSFPSAIIMLGKLQDYVYKDYQKNIITRYLITATTAGLIFLVLFLFIDILKSIDTLAPYAELVILCYSIVGGMAVSFLIATFFDKFRINPTGNNREIATSIKQTSYFMHFFLLGISYHFILFTTYTTENSFMQANPILLSSIFYYTGQSFDQVMEVDTTQPFIFRHIKIISSLLGYAIIYILKTYRQIIE